MLSEQWGRLTEAVNKGLHADMIEPEVRRCLVRTILLLDDVIGLKAGPFTVKPELDIEMMMPSQRRKTNGDKSSKTGGGEWTKLFLTIRKTPNKTGIVE
jgi:hypothetical protein